MGEGGRDRLGTTSAEFDATLDPQVPRPTLDDSEAEAKGELVERLDDNGWHNGLIAIALHGGDVEPHTDQQAERVRSQLAAKSVSSWRITSTDIHEACFPLLNSVISRGFRHAVAFHGFEDEDIPHDIRVGGLACQARRTTSGVNRLTAGGRHGIQIEQKKGPRKKYALPIADAVAKVYDTEL